jgi:protein-S-isoprenylcysteine O-methyltransferase Ste14
VKRVRRKGRPAGLAGRGREILGRIRRTRIFLTWKDIIRGFFSPLFVLSLVLLSAWNFHYWQGWLFGLLGAVVVWTSMILFRDRKAPAEPDLRTGKAGRSPERWYLRAGTALTLVLVVGSAMDGGHVHASPRLGILGSGLGLLLFFAGHGLSLWAAAVNDRFASPAGSPRVLGRPPCAEGPYGRLRHPGYAAAILYTFGTPLLLGSLWGLIPAALFAGLVALRTAAEDGQLMAAMTGYKAYARKVRPRLLPGIW